MSRHAKRECPECGREIFVVWCYTERHFPMHETEVGSGKHCRNSNKPVTSEDAPDMYDAGVTPEQEKQR